MSSPEQLTGGPERGLESAGDAARERQAELLKNPEKAGEQSPERAKEALEHARADAKEQAVSVERPAHESGKQAADTHVVHRATSKQARDKAYKDILRHTQAEMKPAARNFSKVIHQPVVEKASAAAGSTVARPNAILFGALFALILSGGVYIIAKYYGYTLSGFETIAAFAIGWVFGMLVDFVRVALRKQ